MLGEGFAGFLDVVREGHPSTPIIVVSPVLRPDAEDEPNRLGATLADIRHTIETVTRERIVAGDETLALVAGESIITAEHLGDGIHPDDEGHKRIAATVGKALTLAMKSVADAPSAEAAEPPVMTVREEKPKRNEKAGRDQKAGRDKPARDEGDVESDVDDEIDDEIDDDSDDSSRREDVAAASAH